MRGYPFLLSLLLLFTLSGCIGGGSGGSDDDAAAEQDDQNDDSDRILGDCEIPLPPEVRQYTLDSPLPNSFDRDRTDDTTEADVTRFHVAVLLPERCAEDRFPVVIESHGYSGNLDSEIDEDGSVASDTPHFPAIDELFATLPRHGYVGVSFDERGHGNSIPENGGGYARIIAPRAETQDARYLLDWLYEQAPSLHIERQEDSGVARDINAGLIGYSYGGGYQFGLSQLDDRIDTIVPNGTWHSLMYSLLPGDAVKRSFTGLLCLLAETGNTVNTPAVARMCELMGPASPQANLIRTRADLIGAMEADGYTEAEVVELFDRHTRHLQRSAEQGQPWCQPGELGCSSNGDAFVPRSVPTLLLQGNRDVLFNLTDAYWNWAYFKQAADEGVPVSILSTEGGHMNPLANQTEGSANCGGLIGTDLILSWFDFHLKGEESSAYTSIPSVCISVADTQNADSAEPAGLVLQDFPVGSQPGATGGIPARLETSEVSRPAPDSPPTFVSVHTVTRENEILAGIPRIDEVTVANTALPGTVTPVAYLGIGIQRGSELILVDDQVTSLLEGTHTSNPNIGEQGVLLAGVGEQLQFGDEVGLLVYSSHVQYSAVSNPGAVDGNNRFDLTINGLELPILDLSSHPTARLQ
ncbi:CocE/NonD family hydrolase [Marinobacter alexandrii]|jgi:ABC-2 type transport system ATP-binding protein|uniref:CocE/NonD family hydrolase n=1 Tax=Marinobacter alexandrii TaxID=2570351 RepID=UPI002ABE81A4|nr:CocE/NonD family hydrolase [Marinobacter alexandrii]